MSESHKQNYNATEIKSFLAFAVHIDHCSFHTLTLHYLLFYTKYSYTFPGMPAHSCIIFSTLEASHTDFTGK